MTNLEVCQSCRVTKAHTSCSSCEGPLCKNCFQQIDPGVIEFGDLLPASIQGKIFCYGCYDEHALPLLQEHRETVEKAREVRVIMKSFRGQVSIVKKARLPIEVNHCQDRQEAQMKLAYMAVKEGFNALLRTVIDDKKIIENEYQKTWWSANATPAIVRESFSEDKYVAFDN